MKRCGCFWRVAIRSSATTARRICALGQGNTNTWAKCSQIAFRRHISVVEVPTGRVLHNHPLNLVSFASSGENVRQRLQIRHTFVVFRTPPILCATLARMNKTIDGAMSSSAACNRRPLFSRRSERLLSNRSLWDCNEKVQNKAYLQARIEPPPATGHIAMSNSTLSGSVDSLNEQNTQQQQVKMSRNELKSIISTAITSFACKHSTTKADIASAGRTVTLFGRCFENDCREARSIPRQMEESGRRIYIAPVIKSHPSLLSLL